MKKFYYWRRRYTSSIQWKIMLIFIMVVLIFAQLIGTYLYSKIEEYYIGCLVTDLKSTASIFQDDIEETLLNNKLTSSQRTEQLNRILKKLIQIKNTRTLDQIIRVQITDTCDNVLGSTSLNDVHIKRPTTENDFTQKYYCFNKDGQKILVLPKSFNSKTQQTIGKIYIEASLQETTRNVKGLFASLSRPVAASLLATGLLIILLARTLIKPIIRITDQAALMAAGNLESRIDINSNDEIGMLAKTLNHLAENLCQALEQRKTEQEKLESVLANMNDGVLAADHTGTIIVKNLQAENLFQQSIQIGDDLVELLPNSSIQEPQLISIKSPHSEEQATLKVIFTPLQLADDNQPGVVALIEDVTQQHKLEEKQKKFVANVSHELRTPLTTIMSYIETVIERDVDPDKAEKFLQIAYQEAERMTRLIQDLLKLSQLDAEIDNIPKFELSSEKLIKEAALRFQKRCWQKGISLTYYLETNLPSVSANRDKIMQVFDNLLSNALKATNKGNAIAIIGTLNDGVLEIAIADSGVGIRQTDLNNLFERFYRVDKARSRNLGGTGLGLSIAKEIITEHNGVIAIFSIYNKGSIFAFSLPTVHIS